MNTCCEYMSKLSAYADGELNAQDTCDIEKHLAQCRDCSALLAIYKEISGAISSGTAPVPGALRGNVLDAIRNDEAVPERRKFSSRTILLRYIPLAACLVAAFLAWGLFRDIFISQDSEAAYSEQMFEMMGGFDSGSGGTGGSENDTLAGGAMPAPAMSYDSSLTEESVPAGIENPDDLIRIESQDTYRMMPWDLANDVSARSAFTTREAEAALDYIEEASYWIIIYGELPEYIAVYQPESGLSLPGWDAIYIIPGSDVLRLLDKISEDIDNAAAVNTSLNLAVNTVKADIADTAHAIVLYCAEP